MLHPGNLEVQVQLNQFSAELKALSRTLPGPLVGTQIIINTVVTFSDITVACLCIVFCIAFL